MTPLPHPPHPHQMVQPMTKQLTNVATFLSAQSLKITDNFNKVRLQTDMLLKCIWVYFFTVSVWTRVLEWIQCSFK